MEASLFVGLVAVVIVLLILWKIISHVPTKRRKPRRVVGDTTSFAAHDPMLWGSTSQAGSRSDDPTPSHPSAHESSTWDVSTSDNASFFDAGSGSFDCGGDAGGGGSGD